MPTNDINKDNGINPLNVMDFDVNTLIPFNEFNWDTVAGMDDTYQSIMRGYSNVATQLSNKVANMENKIASYDSAIVDSIDRSLSHIDNDLAKIDTRIQSEAESSLNPIQHSYGNPTIEMAWWIVYRQCEDGSYYPIVELSNGPPGDREFYGPFKGGEILGYHWGDLQELFPLKETPNDGPIKYQDKLLQSKYQEWYADYLANVNHNYNEEEDLVNYKQGGSFVIWSCKPTSTPDTFASPIQPVDTSPTTSTTVFPTVNCPPGVHCSSLGHDESGRPFYIDAATGEKKFDPILEWPNNENNPPASVPSVVTQPIQETSTPTIPISQQPTIPINTPNSGVSSPSSVVCPTPTINIPPCPPSIINVNVPGSSGQFQSQPGEGSNQEIEKTDLSKLIDVISDCCKALNRQQDSRASVSGSDLAYLYSDEGQQRIDTFLESNGLDVFADDLPNTIGEGIKQMMIKSSKEVS